MKKCPFCAEEIQDAAIKCRFCREMLSGLPSSSQPVYSASVTRIGWPRNTVGFRVLLLVAVLTVVALANYVNEVRKTAIIEANYLEGQLATIGVGNKYAYLWGLTPAQLNASGASSFELEALLDKLKEEREISESNSQKRSSVGRVATTGILFTLTALGGLIMVFGKRLLLRYGKSCNIQKSEAPDAQNPSALTEPTESATVGAEEVERHATQTRFARILLDDRTRTLGIVLLAVLPLLGFIVGAQQQKWTGTLTKCKGNLKSIGSVLENYRHEHGVSYPESLNSLVPTELKSVPVCPQAGRDTYSEGYQRGPDGFTLMCTGHNHGDTNFPQYTSDQGILNGNTSR